MYKDRSWWKHRLDSQKGQALINGVSVPHFTVLCCDCSVDRCLWGLPPYVILVQCIIHPALPVSLQI